MYNSVQTKHKLKANIKTFVLTLKIIDTSTLFDYTGK